MKLDELRNIIEFDKLTPDVEDRLNAFIEYYNSIYEKTKKTLIKVKSKYSFENIHQYYGDGKEREFEIRLEFVTGVGIDFSTNLCLNMDGSVDHDDELGEIITDDWSVGKQWTEITDEEWEIYYETIERLFYSWLSYIWQEIEGHETGLKVCITNSGASQSFSLNDYKWNGASKFLDFEVPPKKIMNSLDTPMSLEEIYLQTKKRK